MILPPFPGHHEGIMPQQPCTVFGKSGGVPNGITHLNTDKPAIEHVEMNRLDQPAQGTQQMLLGMKALTTFTTKKEDWLIPAPRMENISG